jgi:hypothetical protein
MIKKGGAAASSNNNDNALSPVTIMTTTEVRMMCLGITASHQSFTLTLSLTLIAQQRQQQQVAAAARCGSSAGDAPER